MTHHRSRQRQGWMREIDTRNACGQPPRIARRRSDARRCRPPAIIPPVAGTTSADQTSHSWLERGRKEFRPPPCRHATCRSGYARGFPRLRTDEDQQQCTRHHHPGNSRAIRQGRRTREYSGATLNAAYRQWSLSLGLHRHAYRCAHQPGGIITRLGERNGASLPGSHPQCRCLQSLPGKRPVPVRSSIRALRGSTR